jgi:hypothetical protein
MEIVPYVVNEKEWNAYGVFTESQRKDYNDYNQFNHHVSLPSRSGGTNGI